MPPTSLAHHFRLILPGFAGRSTGVEGHTVVAAKSKVQLCETLQVRPFYNFLHVWLKYIHPE